MILLQDQYITEPNATVDKRALLINIILTLTAWFPTNPRHLYTLTALNEIRVARWNLLKTDVKATQGNVPVFSDQFV